MRGGPGMGQRQMPTVDDRVNFLSKQLNLTDDQKTKVRDILQDEQDQIRQMMQDSSLSRQDRRSKMMDLHKSTTQKISQLLNDDQKKKYQEMQQRQQERMQQHRHGMQQGGPPPDDARSDK